MADSEVMVVNPQGGDVISNQLKPNVYIINGFAHDVDQIRVSIDFGPANSAVLNGNVWEYAWTLPPDVVPKNHTITVKARKQNVITTLPDITVQVSPKVPAAGLSVGSATSTPTLFLGGQKIANAPITSLQVPVVIRGVAKAGQNLNGADLTGTGITAPAAPTLGRSFLNDDGGAGGDVPATFTLGDGATTLTQGLHGVAVTTKDDGPGTSDTVKRWFWVDSILPELNPTGRRYDATTITFLGKARDLGDAASGIAFVRVTLASADNPTDKTQTRVAYAHLQYGPTRKDFVTWIAPFSLPPAGNYTVIVEAQDNAGNSIKQTNSNVPVGAGTLTVAFTKPADGDFVKGDANLKVPVAADVTGGEGTITWTLYDNDKAVTGATDQTGPVSFAWPTTANEEADHRLTVRASDTYGRKGEASVTVHVDNKKPVVSFTSPKDGDFVNAKNGYTISVDVDEKNVKDWDITVDGKSLFAKPQTGRVVSANWISTDEKEHTIAVIVTDKALNQNDATSIKVTVDNTAPVLSGITPNGITVQGKAVPIDFTVTETNQDNMTWSVTVDGIGVSSLNTGKPTTVTWDTSNFQDGQHIIRVSATDKAGNAAKPATATVNVDNNAPTIVIYSPIAGNPSTFPNVSGMVLVTGCATDLNLQDWKLTDNGADVFGWTAITPGNTLLSYLYDMTKLTGTHVLRIYARDTLNHVSAPASTTVYVTNNKPKVGILSPQYNDTLSSPPTFPYLHGDFSQTGKPFQISFRVTNVPVGHKYSWRIIDNGSNTELTGNGDGTDTGNGADDGTYFAIDWKTDVFGDQRQDGDHRLKVLVTDDAGNSNADLPDYVDVIVDDTPPANLAFLKPDPAKAQGGVIPISISFTEKNPKNWSVLLDDDAANPVAVSSKDGTAFTLDTIKRGLGSDDHKQHKLTLNVTDAADNPASASLLIYVDNKLPTVTLTAPSSTTIPTFPYAPDDVLVTATITESSPVTWEVLLDGQSLKTKLTGAGTSVSATIPKAAIADGDHKIHVRAIDEAGNENLSTDGVVNITEDKTPPANLMFVNPASGSFNKGLISVSVQFDEKNIKSWRILDTGTGKEIAPAKAGSPFTVQWDTVKDKVADGDHTLQLVVDDKAGHHVTTAGATNLTFTVDNSSPKNVKITSPAAGALINPDTTPTITLAGTATEVSDYTWTFQDNGVNVPNGTNIHVARSTTSFSVPYGVGKLREGPHLITLTVQDDAGNSPTIVSISIVIGLRVQGGPTAKFSLNVGADGNGKAYAATGNGVETAGFSVLRDTFSLRAYVADKFEIRSLMENATNWLMAADTNDGKGLSTIEQFRYRPEAGRNELPTAPSELKPEFPDHRITLDGSGVTADAQKVHDRLTSEGSFYDVEQLYRFSLVAIGNTGVSIPSPSLEVVLDQTPPTVNILAPLNPNDVPYLAPPGSIISLVFDVENTRKGGAGLGGDIAPLVHATAIPPRVITSMPRVTAINGLSVTLNNNSAGFAPGDHVAFGTESSDTSKLARALVNTVAKNTDGTYTLTVDRALATVGYYAIRIIETAAPDVTVQINGLNVNPSLANAILYPNDRNNPQNGSATIVPILGDPQNGFRVIWQLPILPANYTVNQIYTITIGNAQDIVHNASGSKQVRFKVGIN